MDKVLTARLVGVMDKLNFSKQSTFLKGRLFVDKVVSLNKVLDLAKVTKIKCCL